MPEQNQPAGAQQEMGIRRSFLQVSEEDGATLKDLAPILERRAHSIVDGFFAHLEQFAQMKEILSGVQVERLKGILTRYIRGLSGISFDADYFERRLAIGEAHVKAGIEPQWFLGAHGYFLSSITEAIWEEASGGGRDALKAILAIQRVMILDVNLALETYYGMLRRKEIERTEERHRIIVENATDVIWSFTPEGKITFMNRGLGGYSRDAFLKKGMPLLDTLQTSESKETLRRVVQRIKDTRSGVQNVETTLLNPNTLARESYRSNLSPVHGPEGELVGIQGITRDVTEVLKLQKKVIDRERLATVGRMAATVAHEIRNPLAGIRGALETLQPKIKGTERDRVIVKDILERIDALNATVQDLLIFSRPLALERVRVPLQAFVEGTMSLLKEDPNFSEVALDCEIPKGLEVFIDPQQGKLAFTNLLLNSAQAMEGKGEMRISASPGQETVEIALDDTGPGIVESAREEIFTPFFTTKPHGTGLGLSIVRWIIEAHGGSINLVPSVTSGAHFQITLPVP